MNNISKKLTNKDLIDIILIQKKVGTDYQKNIQSLYENLKNITTMNTTIVVLHELSYLRYMGITKKHEYKSYAISIESEIIKNLSILCKKKNFYLLFPFYEKSRNRLYNSTIMISPNGKIIGKYRKRNLPNERCYNEKFYFSESNAKFQIIKINNFKIGLMICWDQWHAESYIQLKKLRADIILCPTSIGLAFNKNKKISMPNEKQKWINVISANSLMVNIPVVVVNRIGIEEINNNRINFWGMSFVTNACGDIIYQAGTKPIVKTITMNLQENKNSKKMWNFNDKST